MEKSFYEKYFELEKDNWWFRTRRNMIWWLIKEYNIRDKDKILDYGCGSGFLVGKMQEGGLNAYGVDISQEAIQMGVSRGVKNLYALGSIKSDFDDNYFDMILAMDVVEHIEKDTEVIKELKRLLKPEGHLVIMVPAYQWMWGVQDEVAHHFRRYSMSSISKLAKSAGLNIVRKSYFNTFLFPPVAAVRLASRFFKLKNRESDFDINHSFMNKLLYGIFNFEFKLLKHINFPFGVSILLVLNKNA